MMKTVLNKTLLTVVALLLVIPFAAVALLAGERALAVAAEGANANWPLVALAVGGGPAGERALAVAAEGANANWPLVALAIGGVLVSSWHGLMKHPVL